MNRIDILIEQCTICSNSASADECNQCQRRNEINYLEERESEIETIIDKNI